MFKNFYIFDDTKLQINDFIKFFRIRAKKENLDNNFSLKYNKLSLYYNENKKNKQKLFFIENKLKIKYLLELNKRKIKNFNVNLKDYRYNENKIVSIKLPLTQDYWPSIDTVIEKDFNNWFLKLRNGKLFSILLQRYFDSDLEQYSYLLGINNAFRNSTNQSSLFMSIKNQKIILTK